MTMATIYPYHNKIEQIKKTSKKRKKEQDRKQDEL
jgi:hypothetical protein